MMNFNKLKDGLVFDKESGLIGKALEVNLSENVIILVGEEKEVFTTKLENALLLDLLGAIGTENIFDHDVVMDSNDNLFEITKGSSEDKVRFFKINELLERESDDGQDVSKTDLHVFDGHVILVGNLLTMEPEEDDTFNFNLKVVREMNNGEFVGYHYVGNNKEDGTVDLIKVLFIGHHILEEEDYKRVTLTYDDYLNEVSFGTFVEVNAQELANYHFGMSKKSESTEYMEVEFGEAEEPSCDCECEDCDCNVEEEVKPKHKPKDIDTWEETFWPDEKRKDMYEEEEYDEEWD